MTKKDIDKLGAEPLACRYFGGVVYEKICVRVILSHEKVIACCKFLQLFTEWRNNTFK